MRPDNTARNITFPRTKVFAPWNLFSALLLLPEQTSPGAVKKVLQDFGINVHSASSVLEAAQFMRSRRLDLAIFDYDLPWVDQLACLEPSTHWRGVAVALLSQKLPNTSVGKRVHFTLPKPVNPDLLARALKASYTNMAQQRIATYRHAVAARVLSGTVNHRGWQRMLHQVNVLNLSQTGLCLNAAEPLPQGASLTMSLLLPEISYSMHASGSVIWSHSSGRTGVAFERSACPEMKRLQERLNAWLPRELGMWRD
jgi:CheY-like chemotaxis protein